MNVRDEIIRTTVRLVARGGIAGVTHRQIATESGLSLSSTTWHFATKSDILAAALKWAAHHETARGIAAADRLRERSPGVEQLVDELAAWLASERDVGLALYRLRLELLGHRGALEPDWASSLSEALLAVAGAQDHEDADLVASTLHGLRLAALASSEPHDEIARMKPAIKRLLQAFRHH